jgi:hypothetical protein
MLIDLYFALPGLTASEAISGASKHIRNDFYMMRQPGPRIGDFTCRITGSLLGRHIPLRFFRTLPKEISLHLLFQELAGFGVHGA